MTALNWEKTEPNAMPKERSFDDLPAAGSFQDQRRCGVHPGRVLAGIAMPPASQVQVRDRCNDFDQLSRYLQHALHPDFRRKAVCQKAEIIRSSEADRRCEAWGRHTFAGKGTAGRDPQRSRNLSH